MQILIGREEEQKIMNKRLNSGKSEFIAVYGRRRVGKTFFLRQVYKGKFSIQLTGLANSKQEQQLTNFHIALRKQMPEVLLDKADNWLDAFQQLIAYLENLKTKRKVVFIDELPWFDTPKSGFIQALEHFWNSWASARNDMVLVVCGSATSWMINKLINNKGGLHNRVTKRIKLNPFTLQECEKFLKSKKINLDQYQIIQLYMVFGGVPFYWEEVEKGMSAMQNIEKICFSEQGILRTEFNNLFASLFKKPENYEKMIAILAKKAKGLTRDEIIRTSGFPNAGSTTRTLRELEENGFIRKYDPFGKKRRTSLYQLADFYSLFYLKFIKGKQTTDKNYWLSKIDSPDYRAWSGYAFEQVCLYHYKQIKKALGIEGVHTNIYSWKSTGLNKNFQIDLIIDRRDQIINLCEMKFSMNPFTIDKKYANELRERMGAFKLATKTRKSVFLTFVTTFGVAENQYALGLVQNNLKMEILFG